MSFVYFQKTGEKLSEDQLHDILNEVDLNRNGQVELGEFLQVSVLNLDRFIRDLVWARPAHGILRSGYSYRDHPQCR